MQLLFEGGTYSVVSNAIAVVEVVYSASAV